MKRMCLCDQRGAKPAPSFTPNFHHSAGLKEPRISLECHHFCPLEASIDISEKTKLGSACNLEMANGFLHQPTLEVKCMRRKLFLFPSWLFLLANDFLFPCWLFLLVKDFLHWSLHNVATGCTGIKSCLYSKHPSIHLRMLKISCCRQPREGKKCSVTRQTAS